MDRIARLVSSADLLRRQLWLSLPFKVRLAKVLLKIALSSEETFGKVMYMEFLKAGVQGMPDIKGKPASELDLSGNLEHKLPNNYGADLGRRAVGMLMKMFGGNRRAFIDDVLQACTLNFLSGYSRHIPTKSLKDAEDYVMRAVVNTARMSLRGQRRRPEESIYDAEGRERVLELDERSLTQMIDRMERSDYNKMMRELAKVHPDAPRYIELMVKGFDEKDIVGDYREDIPSLLPHIAQKPITPQAWNQRYKPRIQQVVLQYV